jgi:hypothetical protein
LHQVKAELLPKLPLTCWAQSEKMHLFIEMSCQKRRNKQRAKTISFLLAEAKRKQKGGQQPRTIEL